MVASKDKKSDSMDREYLKKIEKILSNVKEHRRTAYTVYGQIEEQINQIRALLAECPTQESGELEVDTTHIEVFEPESGEYPPIGDTCESNYNQALAIEEKAIYNVDFLKIVSNNIKKFNSYLKKLCRKQGLPPTQKEAIEKLLPHSITKTKDIINDFNDFVEEVEKYYEACNDIIKG